jgi:hypothetical protein
VLLKPPAVDITLYYNTLVYISKRIRGAGLRRFYRSADKSLARPTSRCILFDGENISFDAGLVIYINNTNIPPIMIINRIYETQNLLGKVI